MRQQLRSFLEQHSPAGKKYLLAISGGVDSMVLAHLLISLEVSFELAHCNFKLRAAASDRDEHFLRKWTADHGLTLHCQRFDTKGYAAKNGLSTQMAARKLRYAYFDDLMKERQLNYLLTAHHADDVLETLLLKIGRGSGMESMQGIAEHSGYILRPLLPFSKARLLTYAEENSIEWRLDSSNASIDYQRNYIRHKVVPPLREAFPNFEKSFALSRQQLSDDWKLTEFLLEQELEKLIVKDDRRQKLALESLKRYPSPQSLLHHWLKSYGNFDLRAIISACSQPAGQVFHSENYRLLLDRDYILLEKSSKKRSDAVEISASQQILDRPIGLEFGKSSAEQYEFSPDTKVAAFDFDRLQFPLQLRRWQHGDRFQPLGMKGHKKLSDFFIDQKIDRFEKEKTWLLCNGHEIAWVVGQRISDRFKVTEKTKTVYFARLK